MEPVTPRTLPDDAMLRQLLLGQLPEVDREGLEARFFEDDDCFERMLAVEESLIEAYARGDLKGRERTSFEQHYLTTPTGRQRIALARATTGLGGGSVKRASESGLIAWPAAVFGWLGARNSRVGVAVAAVGLAIVAAGVWAWSQDRLVRRQLLDATANLANAQRTEQDLRRQVDEARVRADRLATDLARQSASAPPAKPIVSPGPTGAVVSLALMPGLTRDGLDQAPQLRLPADASVVVLHLHMSSIPPHGSYRALVRTVEVAEVWRQELSAPRPAPAGEGLIVSVPARVFERGEYLLTLQGAGSRGFEDLATYYFRVLSVR
jgi:hypothetical protein